MKVKCRGSLRVCFEILKNGASHILSSSSSNSQVPKYDTLRNNEFLGEAVSFIQHLTNFISSIIVFII